MTKASAASKAYTNINREQSNKDKQNGRKLQNKQLDYQMSNQYMEWHGIVNQTTNDLQYLLLTSLPNAAHTRGYIGNVSNQNICFHLCFYNYLRNRN